jgi:hypothetical protein
MAFGFLLRAGSFMPQIVGKLSASVRRRLYLAGLNTV